MLTGSIVMFAGSTAPQGWLLCDGSAVSRSTYSALFDIIGTDYGAGDESTTFNVPDLTGRVAIGSSPNYPSASRGGEEAHVLTEQEIPSHSHVVGQHGHGNSFTFSTPSLSHTVTQAVFKYNAPGTTANSGNSTTSGSTYNLAGTTNTNATRSTNAEVSDHDAANCTMSGSITDCSEFNTESSGIDEQHDNMQPYITLNYIIYAGV